LPRLFSFYLSFALPGGDITRVVVAAPSPAVVAAVMLLAATFFTLPGSPAQCEATLQKKTEAKL
jgi:hypothetical protein